METSKTHYNFDSMAGVYDRCNCLFSLGIDTLWRRKVVKAANPKIRQRVLDVCCGTGDVVFSFLKHSAANDVTGLDLSESMIERATVKYQRLEKCRWLRNKTVQWKVASADETGFEDQCFDFVTCSFGIRNVTDRVAALREMHRLLKPRGRVLILEFSLPGNPILRGLYRFYLGVIMPLLGTVLFGSRKPLKYLAQSIIQWHTQANFTTEISRAGLSLIRKVPLTCGIATLWVIRKP